MSFRVTQRPPTRHASSVVLSPRPPEQSCHQIDNHVSTVADGVSVRGKRNMEWPSTQTEPVVEESGETPNRLTLEEQQQLVMQYAPLVRRVARSLPLEIPGLLEFEDAVGYG